MFGHDEKDKEDKDQTVVGSAANDSGDDKDWQHPGKPIDDDSSSNDSQQNDTATEVDEIMKPSEDKSEEDEPRLSPVEEKSEEPSAPATHSDSPANDLIDIKQEALSKLSPLVGHLDQTPDEKFRTLMMMIQASDDQGLIKEAYETAQKIDDEKERAQALLDIVNEINYFTQNPSKSE